MMNYLHKYIRSEEAATLTVEAIMYTVAIIAIAGFLIYQIIGALQTSSEKSSCNGSNEVFCTE